MATSAYQLWLKKREFKAPRPPSSPASKSSITSSLTVSKESSQNSSKPPQDAHESSQSNHAKFHAVSAVETTQVAVKSVARPSGVRKRPRSWLSSREEALLDEEEPSQWVKVAGKAYVAGRKKDKVAADKVDGWKRLRNGEEDVMKAATLKLAHASKVLRQSSATRGFERARWSGRIDEETKVAVVEQSEATRDKSSSLQLTQIGNRKVEKGESGGSKVKRLRFDPKTNNVGSIVGQLKTSMEQNKVVVKKKQSIVERVTGENITKRLRFDDGEESDRVVEERGLPPKSPMKKQRMLRTRMLDESQYWMAVDRFSHLT